MGKSQIESRLPNPKSPDTKSQIVTLKSQSQIPQKNQNLKSLTPNLKSNPKSPTNRDVLQIVLTTSHFQY